MLTPASASALAIAPVTGAGMDCGHHMAEEAPEALAAELEGFFLGELE